jgi:hypothetical protein
LDALRSFPCARLNIRRNFLAFSDAISGQPANWTKIAEWAEKNGHTGPGVDGKPLLIKPLTARKAYERERSRRFGKRVRGKTNDAAPAKPAEVERGRPHPSVRILTPDSTPAPVTTHAIDPDDAIAKLRLQMRQPY